MRHDVTLWRSRAISLALALIAFAGLSWAASQAIVRTDFRAMMPSTQAEGAHANDAELARALLESGMQQTIPILFRSSAAEAQEKELAARFQQELRAAFGARARRVSTGPDPAWEEAFYRVYFARRAMFWPPNFAAQDASAREQYLRNQVQRTRANLVSALGSVHAQIAAEDPTALFDRGLEQMRAAMPFAPLASDDGLFRAQLRGINHYVALVETRESPLGSDQAHAIENAIAQAVRAMRREHADFSVEVGGLHRYALSAEAHMRGDIQWVSAISTISIVLLFLLLFRGVTVLLLSAIPLLGGVAAGIALTQFWFGEVHGLALAFGASLLGVGIDYVAHLVAYELLTPEAPPATDGKFRPGWWNILPGLLLGAATTILGLLALAFGTVPALQQLAVFAGGSVTASLLFTLLVFPPWLTKTGATRTLRGLGNKLLWLTGRSGRRMSYAALVLGLGGAAIGYARARIVDDMRALRRIEPRLQAEMDMLTAALGGGRQQQLVVATGRDEESARRVNDRVYEHLVATVAENQLHSIAPMLPSRAQQVAQIAELRGIASELNDVTMRALDAADLDATQFAAPATSFPLLDADAILNSTLQPMLRPFRVATEHEVHYITYIDGPSVPTLAEIESIPGVRLFSETDYLGRAYRNFRTRTMWLVGLGLLLVFGLCAARYRSLKRGVLAISPALLASIIAVGLSALWSTELHLLHFAAVLMVLSMGEDYAVFMLELNPGVRLGQPLESGARHDDETEATLVGIFLAAITTVISFLLLAFSKEPALAALGQVVAIGIGYSFLLAPLVRNTK